MRELGLRVIEPQQQRQEITPEQRKDLLNGKTIDGSGKSIFELDDDTWKRAITSRVDAVFSSDDVAHAATVVEGLQAAQAVAPRYNLSIQIKSDAADDDKSAIAFALVDDDGEVIRRHRKGKGKREGGSRVKVAKPGSYFGDCYKLSALQELIEQRQIDWSAEQALQALLNSREDEEEEEHNEHEHGQITVGETHETGARHAEPETERASENVGDREQEVVDSNAEFATAIGRYSVVSSVADTIQPDDREPNAATRQLVIDQDTERRRAVERRRKQQQRQRQVSQSDGWEYS